MQLRSTAYGEEVLGKYLSWLKFFYLSWRRKDTHFLLSAQGDPGANPVRAEGVPPLVRAVPARSVEWDSHLPPLWYRTWFFETDRVGNLKINGERSPVNIGMDLKAWALMALPEADGGTEALFVIGTPGGKGDAQLSMYGFHEGKLGPCLQSIPLGATFEAFSKLVCLGRHVFAVHGGRLFYFYLSPFTERLEEVCIGEGARDDRVNGVSGTVTADGYGNVFWISRNEVYGMRIGAPSRLVTVGFSINLETVKLVCSDRFLFVYRREKGAFGSLLCEAYRTDCPQPERLEMHFTSGWNSILGVRDVALWYLKTQDGRGTVALCSNEGHERQVSEVETVRAFNWFCLFGNVIAGARYAGYDEHRNIVYIKA